MRQRRSLHGLLVLVFCTGGLLLTPRPAVGQVSGTVVDSGSSAPIEGVLVTLQATDTRTVTDADGFFELPELEGADLVIVAAAKGYFHAAALVSTPVEDIAIEMDAVPQEDDPEYVFKSPILCGFCHPDQKDEWDASRMSQTGLNRWVYDLYDGTGTPGGDGGFVYSEDSVHAEADPNSECAACHQPVRWLANDRDIALGDIDMPNSQMRAGVSCDVCHKMADVNVANIALPGPFAEVVTITRPTGEIPEQVQYGVLGDASFVDLTNMRASYQPQLVAEVCGVCHEENTDHDDDGDYLEEGSVNVQSTYSEWAASSYADPTDAGYKSCAGCHMPAKAADEEFELCNVVNPPLLRSGAQIHAHEMAGTSPEFLENAVTLTLSAELVGESVEVEVTIENDRTGHHVPGGIPLHHMILLVEATAPDGTPLTSSGSQVVDVLGGAGDPAEGYYEGLPGKTYAKVLEDGAGDFPVFYTEAVAIRLDSRIAAGSTDTTNYSFAAQATGGEATVRARLIYRRAWRSLVDDKGWTTDGLDNELPDIAAPHFGALMEESTVLVELPDPPGARFIRGDVDGNGLLALGDPIQLLDYMFQSGSADCVDAGDIDDSGTLHIGDPIRLLNYLFGGGAAPAAPFPDCGTDPTEDGPTEDGPTELGCVASDCQ